MTEPMTLEREAFEKWYAENAFNYGRDPIGSRECGLQWSAWQGRAHLAQPVQAVDALELLATEYERTGNHATAIGLRTNGVGNNAFDYEVAIRAITRALASEKAGPVDGEVLVAIDRGEGYEDVHPDLVAEDCMGNATERGWRWRVVSASPAPDKEE